MGTRGAFGVIIGEKEKIGYTQYDSYPSGCGLNNLQWLRHADLDEVRRLATEAKLVDGSIKPTKQEIDWLSATTDLSVSEQSTDDWYCLTRRTHGHIGKMIACGYIMDFHDFPLDSLFCEWAYMLDLDTECFEVYQGFQDKQHDRGRFADRVEMPKPPNEWQPRYDGDKFWWPVALIASWPLDDLPNDEEMIALEEIEESDTAGVST